MPQRTNRSYFRENTKIIAPDGTITPGDRFLSTDEPTEETFKRLIESCAFISEKDDAANTAAQGLVKITSGNNAKANNTPTDGFTYAAQIKNLPTVAEAVQTIGSLVNTVLVKATASATESNRNAYTLTLSQEFLTWLSQQLDGLSQAISLVASQIPDISGIEQDIQTINGQIQNLQTDVSNLQSDVSTLQSTVSNHETRIGNNETNIQANTDAIAAISTQDGSVIGEYKFMPVPGAPNVSYLLCNGAAVSRNTYAALFAKIGTTFGAGDGSTTFNLPDFSGKGFRGYDAGDEANFGNGVSGGNDAVTLVPNNIPPHNHPIDQDTTIALGDAAGSSTDNVAKGDDNGSDVYDVNVQGNTDDNLTTTQPVLIANPYLVAFVYIKAVV